MEKEFDSIQKDEFGRYNGILPINKPKWKTSHDMVDVARKKFETRKVGHAGTLDPFAEGLLMLLVGKSTKLSDIFLNKDKSYAAEILIGYGTETGDVEGDIVTKGEVTQSNQDIEKVIQAFEGKQDQYVPVFSSVKVSGQKLRVLARSSKSFEIIENPEGKKVIFHKENGEKNEIDLPKKKINIYSIEIESIKQIDKSELDSYFKKANPEFKDKEYKVVKINVKVSKGTYVRQLAIDIGKKLGTQAMLISLVRTSVGEYKLQDAVTLM